MPHGFRLLTGRSITLDPQRSRHIHNHHFDSRRWDRLEPRDDDVVIVSPYKCGTTWVQAIVAHLVFEGELPAPLSVLSPWLEANDHDLDALVCRLEQQRHRRFIKSHLPLDALPWDRRRRFLYIARDGRDVAMSLWNHYRNWNDQAHTLVSQVPNHRGETFPRPPADLHTFLDNWLHRGWLDWERDGWPYWSFFHNVQSWWEQRDQPNILMLHYAELQADLPGQISRVASFLGLEISKPRLAAVAAAVNFAAMRQRSEHYAPYGGRHWRGGANTFFNRGTNGRWRSVLSQEQLKAYDRVSRNALSPSCHDWLHGERREPWLAVEGC